MEQSAAILIALVIILQVVPRSEGEARAQIINMTCDQQRQHNQTLFIPNFVNMMGRISTLMRNSLNATAVVGTGPGSNYGLAHCYGDLTNQDCILCFSEVRTVLPSCFPNNGGRIYLDGCFMRVQNYSFYHEYTGPNDHSVCGNTTPKNISFQDTVKRAVLNAATDATRDGDYFARIQMPVAGRNESAYVLAECWKTLSPNACRACSDNASASISKCLPWSEGRVLNTGCFMRFAYEMLKLLELIGRIIAIVVSVVSSVVILAVVLMIVLYDKKDLVLYTTSWFSDLDLHTAQSQGVLSDGREIAVKRLFINNKFRAAYFYNEVNMVSSVEHKNLVKLLGYSCSGPETILVYKYLPNMSLDHFIFDEKEGRKLTWEKRSFQNDKSHINTAITGTL
ncbi:hypothetical protein L1987_11328 [Smallanthus sonchifolius]|uniref:Uncharacterized protein n=1 Tax=Smallanthus sonchifolius TaxID=185202 RepID=A0ACB9JCW8_9ASTR|nr:hypothetical protein L1987_11328 [Smallanthus sonchifolius]